MLTQIQKEVLNFIIETIKTNSIEFQVTGGLAVLYHGGNRPLYDIDIDIYNKDADKIRELFKEYITEDWNNDLEGPDDEFDVWVLKLEIKGIPIDISQIENFKVKTHSGKWVAQPDHLDYSVVKFEGMELPVQNKESLIIYKKFISRDIDLIDIETIS
jgi:hypothetical protein